MYSNKILIIKCTAYFSTAVWQPRMCDIIPVSSLHMISISEYKSSSNASLQDEEWSSLKSEDDFSFKSLTTGRCPPHQVVQERPSGIHQSKIDSIKEYVHSRQSVNGEFKEGDTSSAVEYTQQLSHGKLHLFVCVTVQAVLTFFNL